MWTGGGSLRIRELTQGGQGDGQITDLWRPEKLVAYCYLLGLYLGDGHIAYSKGHPTLRLYMDRRYRHVVTEAAIAMAAVFIDVRVRRYEVRNQQMTVLALNHAALPVAFPDGPGKKHTRPIVLEPWQLELTRWYPEAFLRGLIHSDVCRTVNRFKTRLPSGRVAEYECPRYFFSNLSADIRRLFRDQCELLGIRGTQSNPRHISISHRHSVAKLDWFVGPKA